MDFLYKPCGSIVVLYPQNPMAEAWIILNIDMEPWQSLESVFIESRCFDDIYYCILEDNLTIGAHESINKDCNSSR